MHLISRGIIGSHLTYSLTTQPLHRVGTRSTNCVTNYRGSFVSSVLYCWGVLIVSIQAQFRGSDTRLHLGVVSRLSCRTQNIVGHHLGEILQSWRIPHVGGYACFDVVWYTFSCSYKGGIPSSCPSIGLCGISTGNTGAFLEEKEQEK